MIDFSRFNSIFELTEYFNTEDKCRRANFSVTVGTIFENTKISLRKWFILHKVRTLFAQEDVTLSGVVECDEMYLGGHETNKHETKKTKGTQGGAKTKTPVFGMTMKWKTEDVDTDSNVINLTVYSKFVNEGLDVNSDSYKQVIEDCMTASEDIINAIASENAEKISQYVSSL